MRLSIRTEGFPRTARALARVAPANNRVRERALVSSMEEILDLADRDYLRGPRPRRVAPRTYDLIRSLRIDKRGLPTRIEGGSPLEYGAIHEYAKRPGSRAFLAPALKRLAPDIVETFRRVWGQEIRAAFRKT